jgi:alkylhydroperoxidase family enzyme
MPDPHAEHMREVLDAVLEGPGTLDPGIRQAAASGGDVPEVLRAYVDKVKRHAYQVTDEDVAALLAAGYSEDQIFELTVSCAVGAGRRRREAGLRAIAGEAAR